MVACAYCERPLICDHCQTGYAPADAETYESLSEPEVAIVCPSCEKVLVCHWCKTPYDGLPPMRMSSNSSEVPTGGEWRHASRSSASSCSSWPSARGW